MLHKMCKKCVNYETISYLICGVLTTAVDFGAFWLFRETGFEVEVSQALSWLVAVVFAYVVNKLVVFRNFDMRPSYMAREGGAFVAARAFSGIFTWIIMVAMVRLGGDRGILYELFCKFIVSVINMVLNYVFSKLWIFKKKPE